MDSKYTMIFASFLEMKTPYVEEEGMRNIETSTGVSATSDVNADKAEVIGFGILKSMAGKH